MDLLPTVEFPEEMDTLSWVQERLENFLSLLSIDSRILRVWKSKVPLNLKCFVASI